MKLFKRSKQNKSDVLILYGTKSGNSKLIAQKTQKYFKKLGLIAICKNMSGYSAAKLTDTKNAFVIVSTHGEGEPPPSAKKFFKECLSDSMPVLDNLRYSICALGDSSYQEYCRAGKDLEDRFTELGASSIYPRMDCDVEFSDDAIKWIKIVGKKLALNGNGSHTELYIEPIHKNDFYNAKISNRKLLTNDTYESPVYHLELDISNSEINYSIGDSIEIYPRNPEWLVQKIIEKITVNPSDRDTITQQLTQNFEITSISKNTIKNFAEISGSGTLQKLLKSEKELTDYTRNANLLDLLTDYQAEITDTDLQKILPKVKGRQYSISSSHISHPGELHATIKTIRFDYNGTKHEGAGSVYANEVLKLGSDLTFRIYPNDSFSLPDNLNTPIILIGVSTGIAPYRAILYERHQLKSNGKTWLIFGNQYHSKDFLYQNEIETFLENGTLTRLDTVFSRDGSSPRYVHEIIKAKSVELQNWLNEGAHIYICGSIEMGKSVKRTISEIFDNSRNIFDTLIKENRLHEDTY